MIDLKEIFGDEIPMHKKKLAEIIIMLLQAYRDDSGLLETEAKQIKETLEKAIKKAKEQKNIRVYI